MHNACDLERQAFRGSAHMRRWPTRHGGAPYMPSAGEFEMQLRERLGGEGEIEDK